MRRCQQFVEAAVAMLLFFAALNAASYFVLSEHGTLLGYDRGVDRIGFPWVVWQDGAEPSNGIAIVYLGADGYFDYRALAIDAAVALVASLMVGLVAMVAKGCVPDDQPRRPTMAATSRSAGPPQFSLRALMVVTAIVAVALAYERAATDRARAFSLAAIYVLGPSLLIWSAYATRHRNRAERSIAVWLVLAILVAGAVASGVRTNLADFTRVLLGFYVYWTPQCVLFLAADAVWRRMKKSVRKLS
jgi:hypothetical protein